MPYRYNDTERANLKWFSSDSSKSTLLSIWLRQGTLRGLKGTKVEIRYPITAISGRNGAGKTTLLAMAACAYHNGANGFNPLRRQHSYYTFSDFFIQTPEELPPQGVVVWYEFLYNHWKHSRDFPNGIGRGWQICKKRAGGRWSDYSERIARDVVFYGIDRIVPHAERSVYRAHRSRFRDQPLRGWEDKVRGSLERIVGRKYDRLSIKSYSRYTLPVVHANGKSLSGFNLGAGENALINILSGIFSCASSPLIVIDEIELGLHEQAQIRLVRELSELCAENHLQVICTTHSPAILQALPPEARIFLDGSSVIEGVAVDYAAGRLSGKHSAVLDVLVEDEVSSSIVVQSLDLETRARLRVLPVGSSAAVIRMLAGRHRDGQSRDTIAFLDGDMKSNRSDHCRIFHQALEKPATDSSQKWVDDRLHYLPGDEWPERWVISSVANGSIAEICTDFRVSEIHLRDLLNEVAIQPRHREYIYLADSLSLSSDYVRERLTHYAVRSSTVEQARLESAIRSALARAES